MDFHSMKRKELQALCKKHKIPANLRNLEMADRLTFLLKGEDKLLGENGCEIESDVENKRVKKVRFSPEIQTFEFQKSEIKYFTRSRGRRLVEKCAAAKEKDTKGGIKNGALGGNLPSDIDNVASNDAENKDRVMITRKSLRRKEVVDEGRSKNEDVEKGLKKKGRERNLRRQGKDKARDKEKSPVVLGLRRSKRNVSSCNEPLVTLDDLVEDVNYERKRKRQRGDLVKEQESVLVDSISIELTLAPLSPNVKRSERAVPEIIVGKFARKADIESNKQTVDIEDFLRKDLTSEELPDDNVQPSMAEVAEGATARDSENKGFIDNLKKQKGRSGSNSDRKSPPRAESTGIQVWVELSIDMETMSRRASLDHLVEDERISSVKSQQCIENQGFQSVSSNVLDRDENANLHGLCEIDRSNYNGDCSSTLNSGRALDRKDLSQIMQTNKAEINDVSGDRNNDQREQICTMSAKSDESLKENCDSADKLCESSCLELFRSVARTLMDENDNGGEKSEQSADWEMKHLGVPSDDEDIETSCSRIEYETLISSSETTENVLELNSTSENPESNESYENQPEKDGDADLIESCIQAAEKVDNNFGELASSEVFMITEVSTISMNVDIPLEEKLQFPILNMCGSEANNVAQEVLAHDQLDLENLNELDQSVEDRHFDKPEDEIDDEDSLGLQKNDAGLKSREHSPSKDRDWCEADSVAEVDRNYGHGELKSDELSNNIENRSFDEKYHFPRSTLQGSDESTKSVEGRPSEEECNSPDKCRVLSPSRRILEDRSANADKDFNKSGDEMFDENGTKEDSYDEINEKISDFASSKQLSEADFTINIFQEEFSCKEQEDNGKENRENLTSTFSQVQFSMPEIHGEDEIVNIGDDVSSSLLYKHHEILKESDVADTINEYIESESTMNQSSSLRIDDTGDTLNISLFTKVCRKSELSDERDQEMGAADLEETALRSSKISDSKPATTTTQRKNSDEMRTILIHGRPRKIQMTADMKENLPSFKKIEKIGFLTTVKPTTKRTALKDVFIQQK